jgi:hypothetical protein
VDALFEGFILRQTLKGNSYWKLFHVCKKKKSTVASCATLAK